MEDENRTNMSLLLEWKDSFRHGMCLLRRNTGKGRKDKNTTFKEHVGFVCGAKCCMNLHHLLHLQHLTLLKYLMSSSEASGVESSFSFLLTSHSWAGSVLCDRLKDESVINSFFCLSWIERFLNSRAASRASIASSSWSRERSSWIKTHT